MRAPQPTFNPQQAPAARTLDAPVLLTKMDMCARLQVSARTLENMVKDRAFPPGVRVGRFVYWTEGVVAKWVARQFGAQEAWKP